MGSCDIFLRLVGVPGPSGMIIYKITDTYVKLKVNVTIHGNIPIVQYRFKFGDTVKYSKMYTSPFQASTSWLTNLASDTSYNVSAAIRNSYKWSLFSKSKSITTLPSGKYNSKDFCLV